MVINEWLQQQENIFCTYTGSKPCYLRSSLDKKKRKEKRKNIEPESIQPLSFRIYKKYTVRSNILNGNCTGINDPGCSTIKVWAKMRERERG